jgi:hypothetical protein
MKLSTFGRKYMLLSTGLWPTAERRQLTALVKKC